MTESRLTSSLRFRDEKFFWTGFYIPFWRCNVSRMFPVSHVVLLYPWKSKYPSEVVTRLIDCALPSFLLGQASDSRILNLSRRDFPGFTGNLHRIDSRPESEYVRRAEVPAGGGLRLGREMTRRVMFSERSFARDIFVREVLLTKTSTRPS